MIREVDLVSYLPPFMADYKEIHTALTAENPEFMLVWKAADRVLKNEFIATADEYGISRFEKMLRILPSCDDTLDNRRSRVQFRWLTTLPYTWRMLIRKLVVLCGENDFTITKKFEFYRICLDVQLELSGQVEELDRIIETILPCNMIVDSKNKIPCGAKGFAFVAGGVCSVEMFFVTNDSDRNVNSKGVVFAAGGVCSVEMFFITNDSRELVSIDGKNAVGSGMVISEHIEVEWS